MQVLNEARHAGEFILAEGEGNISRETAVIADSVAVLVGQVLGFAKSNAGAVTVGSTSFAGTGNGVMTKASPAFGAGVMEGSYRVQLIDEGTNAGDFEVIRPDGSIDGIASVGVAYDGQVKFTIADGSTDFASPAAFTVPVVVADALLSGKYSPLDLADTTGLADAAAIAIYPLSATETDRKIAIIKRLATVNGKCLEWPDAISADDKAAAIAKLAKANIIIR